MLKVFVVSILISGCCPDFEEFGVEECELPPTNLDSIFRIGDSVLASLYIHEAQQKLYTAELTQKLSEKQIKEEIERIVYRDTIIYRKQIKTLYTTLKDTIRDTIYVTDTVVEVVNVKSKKKQRN